MLSLKAVAICCCTPTGARPRSAQPWRLAWDGRKAAARRRPALVQQHSHIPGSRGVCQHILSHACTELGEVHSQRQETQ